MLIICLLLPGCQTIGDAAHDLGSYLPVMGERCEHWQCMTSSGQAASDAKKAAQTEEPAEPPEERKRFPTAPAR